MAEWRQIVCLKSGEGIPAKWQSGTIQQYIDEVAPIMTEEHLLFYLPNGNVLQVDRANIEYIEVEFKGDK